MLPYTSALFPDETELGGGQSRDRGLNAFGHSAHVQEVGSQLFDFPEKLS